MLNVSFMKPFYTKVTDTTLRLVFAYQYLSIVKDDEIYHFIPVEGKEIVFNLETWKIENFTEVFVFQRGNRFIRLPIYQLILVQGFIENVHEIAKSIKKSDFNTVATDIKDLFYEIEKFNIKNAIDIALDHRDEVAFRKLVAQCK